MKKSISWVVFVYGILIAALGYVGYYHSQSKASLWSGLGSGLVLILSSFFVFSRRKFGMYVGLLTTLFLTALFCYRYAITHGNLPAILSVISGAVLIYLLAQTGKWKK